MKFDFEGEGESASEQWFKDAIDANKWEVFTHRAAQSAAMAGTGYITILPAGVIGEDGKESLRGLNYNAIFTYAVRKSNTRVEPNSEGATGANRRATRTA
jgi:hypothetical protein